MDSFASQDLQFDDGQNNKEAIPDEIQQYGFRPPVRAQNGTIIAGHHLAAQHLNQIFYDLYTKIAAQEARINELENKAGS